MLGRDRVAAGGSSSGAVRGRSAVSGGGLDQSGRLLSRGRSLGRSGSGGGRVGLLGAGLG